MPKHLEAFVVVIFLGITIFIFSKSYACSLIHCSDFTRRRNAWLFITSAAFLSQNFWLFSLLTMITVLVASSRETRYPSLFLLLLLAFPPVQVPIPGFGIINYIFQLNYPRLLSLTILLPAFLKLLNEPVEDHTNPKIADILVVSFIVLATLLQMRDSSITDTFRYGFTSFIDIYLPYYVMSRGLKNIADFRDALLAFVIAVTIAAFIAVFEHVRHWVLFKGMLNAMDIYWNLYGYQIRSGSLRAVASAGHAIVLGYLIVIGIGIMLFFHNRTSRPGLATWMAILILVAGLYATLSRGPWVGAIALLLVYISLDPQPIKGFLKLGLIGTIGIIFLSASSKVQNFIALLPFIGTTDAHTVTYRQQLFENSFTVIMRNLWFGSTDYLKQPEMLALATRDGFIDIVNTYVQISFDMGLVGLTLFIAFFFYVLKNIYRAVRSLNEDKQELQLLGRVLFSTIVAALVIIGTVSSISHVPILYWILGGIGIAYWRMVNSHQTHTVIRENNNVKS